MSVNLQDISFENIFTKEEEIGDVCHGINAEKKVGVLLFTARVRIDSVFTTIKQLG